MGCPSGVGPELVVRLLGRTRTPVLVVGDRGALEAAARRIPGGDRLVDRLGDVASVDAAASSSAPPTGSLLLEPSGRLLAKERPFGTPTRLGGRAQLEYVEAGYRAAKALGVPLVTGPVSKEAIARSGLRRAKGFRGHTEWLEALDGASYSVMCFASPKLVTSVVTTHIPLMQVSEALTSERVALATGSLVELCGALGKRAPRIAVCSLNPHAGEGELLGSEERRAIVPGMKRALRTAGRARISGPIGAETAYRKAAAGAYDGVVAMYHDQATIPMKLLDFGGAVNVTLGLSIVRTSVDHGTAYDIAGRGLASVDGLEAALELALALHARRA